MEEILTPEALEFIEKLHTRFDKRRIELLEKRQVRQKNSIAARSLISFLKRKKSAKVTGRSPPFRKI